MYAAAVDFMQSEIFYSTGERDKEQIQNGIYEQRPFTCWGQLQQNMRIF